MIFGWTCMTQSITCNIQLMSVVLQGFLVYDSQWIQVSEEQLAANTDFYKSSAIFNAVSAKDLDPKDPDVLNKMFEPYIFQSENVFYRLNVSKREPSRKQLDQLELLFEARLKQKQARKGGICPIREQLHKQLFDEIIRQATLNLPERGLLLMRVRDNLKMTFAAYQTLYEGSLVFGSRKAHVAETGINQLQTKLDKLKKKKMDLENKKIMLENQLQAVEQGFREIRAIEQKSRNDELTYINGQTKRLQQYLQGYLEG